MLIIHAHVEGRKRNRTVCGNSEDHFCIRKNWSIVETRRARENPANCPFPFPRLLFFLRSSRRKKGEKEEKKKGSSIYRYYLYFSSESESRPREEDRSLSRDGERSSKGSFLLLSSLAKLTTGTKCVTTILVVYLFLPGVTLILINLSFLPGRWL